MKLYILDGGKIYTNYMYCIPGGEDRLICGPVSFYLIEHENGYVLFDTGYHQKAIEDFCTYLDSDVAANYAPVVTADNSVVKQLEKLGIKPEEIKYIVLSHLHMDHVGSLNVFPDATVFVQRAEYEFAQDPGEDMSMYYIPSEYKNHTNWNIIDGAKDGPYDIFGDGKLIAYLTPGHSPGHMSLLVNLEKTGPVMLAGDAAYVEDNISLMTAPVICCDKGDYVKSLKLLSDLRNQGVKIIIGHDAAGNETNKKAPEYYD